MRFESVAILALMQTDDLSSRTEFLLPLSARCAGLGAEATILSVKLLRRAHITSMPRQYDEHLSDANSEANCLL